MKKFILLCLTSLLFFSCASGKYVLTGEKRAEISPSEVKLYGDYPAKYETIGIVTAKSDAGWTDQDSINYAIEELKAQAAKIGANGVVIEKTGTTSDGVYIDLEYGIFSECTSEEVQGKAIYVYK